MAVISGIGTIEFGALVCALTTASKRILADHGENPFLYTMLQQVQINVDGNNRCVKVFKRHTEPTADQKASLQPENS
jgi:hypothetical protein